MTGPRLHAAIDLGASSARLFAGQLDDGTLTTSEVTRMANGPVMLPDGLHWDIARIHQVMLEALAQLAQQADGGPLWVGIDGWGVDYGLLDSAGHLLGLPFHYRDARTAGQLARASQRLGPGRIYDATGIQEMEINTLFQLLAERDGAAYGAASQLLLVPDLLGYFLTGQRRFERTNASTTQLVDARTGRVVELLLSELGLRADLFAPGIEAGEVLGPVLPEVAASVEMRSPLSVVAVASHDTASAVLGVPALVDDFAYVVSGTWSLVGFELERPVINESTRAANFSNELGIDGTVRFLRNAMGHWMLQECERAWAQMGPTRAIGAVIAEAGRCRAFRSLVDTEDPRFARPGNMPALVRAACAEHGEPVPDSDAELVRCIVDSMALGTAGTLAEARRLADRDVSVVHVVGGGAANELLMDLLAAATGLDVVAGPVEASATGNLLVQLRAAGRTGERREMRAILSRSFPTRRFQPEAGLGRLAKEAAARLGQFARASQPVDL
jgi:rhamnulokinase